MKFPSSVLLTILALSVAGCGGGSEGQVSVYPVSGVVKMNGAVLPDAVIAFAPLDGQPTAQGRTDAEGKYVLTTYEFGDGAAAGKYRVTVVKTISAATSNSGGEEDSYASGHEQAEESANASHKGANPTGEQNLVPASYGSSDDTPLEAEVKASGDNTFNFEIN